MDFDLLVLGDANPDVIVAGAPRAPAWGQREELVEAGRLALGGSGAITACGAARLGLRTAFVGRVGDDAAGRFVLDELVKCGVDVSGCVIDREAGTALTVVLTDTDRTDRAILTATGCLDRLTVDDIPRDLRASHVHVASFFLQPALAAGLPGYLESLDATTSLDTNDDPAGEWKGLDEVLARTTYFLPNDREALAITGADDVEEAARRLRAMGTTPVIKCGGRGALAWTDDGPVRVPAGETKVVDTVGAGDSFNAGFLAARSRGLAVRRSLRVAVAAGSLSTRAAGGTAAQSTWEEASS
ncbi:carbohydrate kinase family protein [Nonomuraea soli]|uniref:Sugar/nucleoside kinase (Ribokinase family) n=1 Tax=Nonomuraea soli TaxID=1032476 RepID=A0A7W0HQW4_9ACTN|nr:carbohydrate kinase family protein [Nonomuraea soli]MBA2891986.1 sugar/nucleoside kinase (ribokinase family) [Nonomuraea soli]